MALRVVKFEEKDCEEWDSFVNDHPEGRFSQLSGYKDVVEKTFSYEPSYWVFRGEDGQIIAVFPSFVKRSWLMGSKLTSQPFCEYGGLVGENLNEEESLVIKRKLTELLDQYQVDLLEVHGGLGLSQPCMERIFSPRQLHQYALLELNSNNGWERAVDRSVRKAIRKAQRSNLECYQETTEKSIAEEFYPLYLRSMKKFGTPPQPLGFFLNCQRHLEQYMRLFLVKDEGRTIAALLGFTTGKRVHIISSPSDERYWDKRPNDLAHWEFIRWAAGSGYEIFDFGPVRYEGQRRYKQKWGVKLFDYSYFFLSRKADSPGKEVIYSNKARLASFLWRRLVPLPLTEPVGSWVRRHLGD